MFILAHERDICNCINKNRVLICYATSNYDKSVQSLNFLVKEAKKDYPHLTDADMTITTLDFSIRHKGELGIMFYIPKDKFESLVKSGKVGIA